MNPREHERASSRIRSDVTRQFRASTSIDRFTFDTFHNHNKGVNHVMEAQQELRAPYFDIVSIFPKNIERNSLDYTLLLGSK